MSSALLAVRLPDGTVRFGFYNGTVDVAHPVLIDRWEGWYDLKGAPWPDSYRALSEDGSGDSVDVWTAYGPGFYWKGRVAGGFLVGGNDPFADDGETDGTPDWVPAGVRDYPLG